MRIERGGMRRWALAALLALAVGGVRPAGAAVTGVVYNSGTGHYYKYVAASGSWSSAKAGAEALGGYLVSVTSDAERQWIDANLRPSGSTMWLGGTDAAQEGTWTWVNGDSWSYSYWNGGEPNNSGNEDNLMVNTNGTWNDVYDSYTIPGYVVEWNTDPNAPPPPILPPDPSDLAATLSFTSTVVLQWTDNSLNELRFEVERRTAASAFARVATLGSGTTTFEDEALAPSTAYTYRVRAANAVGPSGYTNEASVASGTYVPSPAAPSDLVASSAAPDSMDLLWTDNSAGEMGFNVYRRAGGGDYEFLSRTAPDAVSLADSGLAPDADYGYAVRAVGTVRVSGAAEAAGTTLPTLSVATIAGDLKDSAKFGKDSLKASASFDFLEGASDGEADPVAEGLSIRAGPDAAPVLLSIVPQDEGWKVKGAKASWKSPAGSTRKIKVQVDLEQRTVSFSVAGLELAAPPANPVRVSLAVGGDAGTDRRDWEAGKPGVFRFR